MYPWEEAQALGLIECSNVTQSFYGLVYIPVHHAGHVSCLVIVAKVRQGYSTFVFWKGLAVKLNSGGMVSPDEREAGLMKREKKVGWNSYGDGL